MLSRISLSILSFIPTVAFGWTTPVQITGIDTSTNVESAPFLSSDNSTFYFSRHSPYAKMYVADRDPITGVFSNVRKINELDVPGHVYGGWISTDNLRMYYTITGGYELAMSTRQSTSSSWSSASYLTGINSFGNVSCPSLTSNELVMAFDTHDVPGLPGGGGDLMIATRSNRNSQFTTTNMRALSELNTTAADAMAYISNDGLRIFFASTRNGTWQVFQSSRQSLNDLFATPTAINGTSGLRFRSMSQDGTIMFLDDTQDIYISYIPEPATLLLFGAGALALRRIQNK